MEINNLSNNNMLIIGIAGGSGSGKTTLTKNLLTNFSDVANVIYHDNYYKPFNNLTFEERKKINYDHPDAYDTNLMLKHIAMLKSGTKINSPIYDYTNYTRSTTSITIIPKKVLFIEGILILHEKLLCNQMDIKIFVDTDADVRIIRRIKRDVLKRGRTLESVTKQYLSTVKPMHELYVEPSKKNADVIVPEGGKNLIALDLITRKISDFICKGEN